MVGYDWLMLQNGADIRGVAAEGIIGESVTLTTDKVYAFGRGFVLWLWEQLGKHPLRIAVGSDCRLTGPKFVETLERSITSMGCDVLNCGLSSTPSMLLSTKLPEVRADGAIMMTGSHMPFNRNGMKFFTMGQDISSAQMSEIMELAANSNYSKVENSGLVHITNLQAIYSAGLRRMIVESIPESEDKNRPLAGLKIVVDAGNGAGSFYAQRVLRLLGADISDSQFMNPDGRFPNHMPNPEDYEAMRSVVNAVKLAGADMGILFDSDVDRIAIVDSEGRCINRNELVAMASAIVLEEHPGTSIVTDSITSNGLSCFITDVLGGKHHRYQRGYRNVINEAKRLNSEGQPCWLAVETSGHAAFKENSFYDDGAYFATKLVIKLAQLKHQGKTLSSLIEGLPVALESSEHRLKILDGDFSRVASETMIALRQFVSQISGWEEVQQNYEGLRVMCNNDYEKGWFIIRQSLHDPVMPLNIESDIQGGTMAIIKKLKLFFRNVRTIDSSQLLDM
ncbi:MAG: phosphomannomutase/phosphoglucomutase [Bacteroidales bacterium]|nr:phosphomannomutase/phosphoglucomutase [Bacteroidales bacterium]